MVCLQSRSVTKPLEEHIASTNLIAEFGYAPEGSTDLVALPNMSACFAQAASGGESSVVVDGLHWAGLMVGGMPRGGWLRTHWPVWR